MRVKRGVTTHKRHKKVIAQTKGYSKIRRSSYRKAHEAVLKALSYQYRDRRNLKRDMRALWITRIGAGAKQNGMSYSTLTHALAQAEVKVNRKILAELAVNQPQAFEAVVKAVK